MTIILNDKQIDTLDRRGVMEGDYIPNTSLKLRPDGSLTGGADNGYNPTYSTGASATSGTTGEPTLGEALGGSGSTGSTAASFNQPYLQDIPAYNDPTLSAYEERKIRRDQMRLFQAEIDATNKIYDQMVNQANIEGTGRLGSQRAVAARGGILGSDFAGAQKDRVLDYNADIVGGIQAERAAKIAAIEGLGRQSAVDEIARQNAARKEGAAAYLDYLASAQTTKISNMNAIVSAMLTQGIAPDEMDPEQLAGIAENLGVDTNTLLAQYQSAKVAQDASSRQAALDEQEQVSKINKNIAEVDKIEADIQSGKLKTIGEGTMLYNTETGEFFKNPKTYAPNSSSTLSIGAGALTQQAVADVHQKLSETRGEDGYADTGVYMDELSGFVALGGDPKDFIKEYDPDVYINPNDETRSFLQAFMKKPSSDNLIFGNLTGVDLQKALDEARASA